MYKNKRHRNYINYILCFVLTVFLLGLCFGAYHTEEESSFYFELSSAAGAERILPYESEDDTVYVFLPSFSELSEVRFRVPFLHTVSLNGVRILDGDPCGQYAFEKEYTVQIDDEAPAHLYFVKSANVAAMHIDMTDSDLEFVYDDKYNEAPATMWLIDNDGMVLYQSQNCRIRGRGNATWSWDKKPYNLTLPEPADLLGMGADADWILLANFADSSNLHNYAALSLADQGGGMGWTPECRFVDVYINGSYCGLYLLTEKLETGDGRLPLDYAAGDFLCKIDLEDRWGELRNPLRTPENRVVEISEPKELSEEELARIIDLIHQMEMQILDEHSPKTMLDLDSWVHRYLIDEITGNIDADLASSYFYYSNGAFYAGPVWDYDMTFGTRHRNEFPAAFIAKNAAKSFRYRSPYYGSLYTQKVFYDKLVEIYRETYLPILEKMVTDEIPRTAAHIAQASHMNSLRWKDAVQWYYQNGDFFETDPDGMIAYLKERVNFLNRVWLDGETVCTVQYELEPEGSYGNISVPKGAILDTPYFTSGEYAWQIFEGTDFDPTQEIHEDMILVWSNPEE